MLVTLVFGAISAGKLMKRDQRVIAFLAVGFPSISMSNAKHRRYYREVYWS